MLPNVVAHDGIVALHQRAVLVRGRHDLKLAVGVHYQPCPAGAEALGPGIVKLLLEGLEVAKSLVDRVGNGAGRGTTCVGSHNAPEHGVVGVTTSGVDHGGTDTLRHLVDAAHQVLDIQVG